MEIAVDRVSLSVHMRKSLKFPLCRSPIYMLFTIRIRIHCHHENDDLLSSKRRNYSSIAAEGNRKEIRLNLL